LTEKSLDGIHFMLPTPFTNNGEIDVASFSNLVACAAEAGCRGVVCLGVMGEAHRLTEPERAQVVDAVIRAAGGRLTVTVGVSSESHQAVAERTREAQAAGAAAVMVAPARLTRPNPDATFGYYAAVEAAAEVPIVVQDLPSETGVHMDPAFIARLNAELPHARYLKLEDPPTPPKITRVLTLTGPKMGVFGGLGGAFLFEELRRGAIGAMTGFAYPEILVRVHRHVASGQVEQARDLFYRWLPLIRYENQTGIGLSVRKHILTRRGLLASPAVRPPTPAIDRATQEELEDILKALDALTRS
jgi:4-hydroxy-tetrahydrodipicolinate synthase